MAKTRIIGHRGAAGLALENTMPSFEKAVEVGADIIEFDVHTTADDQFVVSHDVDLRRISDSHAVIKNTSLEELRAIPLANGTHIPLLTEVLDFARIHKMPVIVEAKAIYDAERFCQVLDNYSDLDITVASFNHGLLVEIHRLRPGLPLYLGELQRPVAILRETKVLGGKGIDLHYMLINPLTYWLAKRWKLDIMLFTPNNRFIVKLIMLLYPDVLICTNHPERFTQG